MPPTPSTDLTQRGSASLATMLQLDLGNQAVADELVRRYQNRMLSWCRGMGLADAEDAVGRAWLDIVQKLNTYDRSRGPFQPWCKTVTRHAAISLLRASRRHTAGRQNLAEPLEEQPGDDLDPAVQVAEQLDREVEWALAQAAVSRVAGRHTPTDMQIFHRRAAGDPAPAIATDLGVDQAVVYRVYYKVSNEVRVEACRLAVEGLPRRSRI